ncbi:hypothetical protein [Streptomyces sp. NPDC060010]|uniref:hypothetical protein n=1 Tax=Streptomyces sp. NPDC060010 TaxID=3347036 RepID=UPI003690EA43
MRTALRTTAAAFALAGTAAVTVLGATSASAASRPAVKAAPNPAACVATTTVPSVFDGLKVQLVNSADNGASAKLLDEKGAVISTIDQTKPADLGSGLRITGVLSAKPVFEQRSQGGSAPWKPTSFPALSAACTLTGKLVRTDRLDATTTVKVYQAGANHYQARVLQGAKLVGFADADLRSAAVVVGSRTVVVTPDGEVTSWTGAATTEAPALGRYKLVNGAIVKLVKTKGVYGVELTTNHGTFPVAQVGARPIVLQDNATLVVLTPNGVVSGHVFGAATQKAPVFLGA